MRLNEIYRQHQDQANFLCVYIQEAHPEDGWQTFTNINDDVRFMTPKTIDERADLAEMCVLRLNLEMPMALDHMSDEVDELYRAAPERLYLVDAEGRIAYRGGLGPWDFDVEEWTGEIEKLLVDA